MTTPPPPPPPAGGPPPPAPAPSAPPPRSARGAITVAVLLSLIALGLGYYAFELWNAQQRTAQDLQGAEAEVARLTQVEAARTEEVATLQAETATLDKQHVADETEKQQLAARLAATQQELEALTEKQGEIEERLAEFERFTAAFQKMIDTGKLEVSFRRGRMIVQLPARVLFPSGSAELTEQGGVSLTEVAQVLGQIRGKRFIVAGHTDNVPVATEAFPSNWALSTARAVNVTHALVEAGLSPRNLVAAGYSQYDPVATNRTKRGRARNRRIEIILEPRLHDVPDLDLDDDDAAP